MVDRFSIGVNYWPVRKAMYWWRQFDPGELRDDMALMAETGLSPVRIFLLWEDFQPEPDRMNSTALNRLAEAARIAYDHGIKLWVTLFTGHMSGANWFPDWMIDAAARGGTGFPVVTGSVTAGLSPKNPYAEPAVRTAQRHHIREIASVLRGHPALWGWDLGNEPSNCYRPENREQGRVWLREMVEAIRTTDDHPVTLGLHQEDLEEDRGMGPADVAGFCDLMTMHAYPAYSEWALNKTDPYFALYLTQLTGWLSGGREVWLSEFGISTGTDAVSVDEGAAASYARQVLERLRENGAPGALWWCFGDYARALWGKTPFDEKIHERSFGLFRSDLSPKEAVPVLRNAGREIVKTKPALDWIDLGPDEYWEDPGGHIRRLYRKFLASRK